MTARRYEGDPGTGRCQRQALAKAHSYEAPCDSARTLDINFNCSRALYQITILLGSVSIVSAWRPLLWLCGTPTEAASPAEAASSLVTNGHLPLLDLPFS